MADLTETLSSGSTKIVGSDSTGGEQTPIQSTAAGGFHVNLRNNAGAEVLNLPSTIIGGTDGTAIGNLADSLKTTVTSGVVSTVDGNKATYSATITNLPSTTLASDIFTLTGSATKIVRISRVALGGVQTTGSQINVICLRRSTANTGGSSVSLAAIRLDSANPAATATALAYTANPTVGTLVGNIRTRKVSVSAASGISDPMIFDFGTRNGQAVVLRGINEVFAINLFNVTVAGSAFNISIEWTEE